MGTGKMPVFALSISSPGFQGDALVFEDLCPELAELVPSLEALPWELGNLQCGRSEDEFGKDEERLIMSCGTSYTLKWVDKVLTVQSDQGDVGAGSAPTKLWDDFFALASSSPSFSTEKKAEVLEVLEVPLPRLDPVVDEFEEEELMVCKMLGAVNGRREFYHSHLLSWDQKGGLA